MAHPNTIKAFSAWQVDDNGAPLRHQTLPDATQIAQFLRGGTRVAHRTNVPTDAERAAGLPFENYYEVRSDGHVAWPGNAAAAVERGLQLHPALIAHIRSHDYQGATPAATAELSLAATAGAVRPSRTEVEPPSRLEL